MSDQDIQNEKNTKEYFSTYFIFYLQGQDSVEVLEIPNMRPEQPKRKKNSKILPRVKKSVKKLTMQKAKDRRMAGKNQNRNKKMKKKRSKLKNLKSKICSTRMWGPTLDLPMWRTTKLVCRSKRMRTNRSLAPS